jgi:gliding motility-associated-like protein
MKTITYNTVVLAAFLSIVAKAQTNNSSYTIDSLANFNQTEWSNFYFSHHTNPNELPEFIEAHKRDYIHATYFSSAQKLASQPNTPQQACTNIDFENGNLSGWTSSTGYNPLYNAAGCCLTTGGAQVITSGTALDACGGFPIVAPGGNFSVQLGDNNVGGIADRLEQTFNVTPANANFTYKYAVVLQDAGHAIANQPSFQIEMLDSSNNQIPCTFYNVAAGQNIPGFISSTNCVSVVYKPWSSVSVDLTNYIGQNVTIRFTTYDCSLGGHYAYAYIDGSCSNFNISQSANLCEGSSIQLLAPAGFASYNWTLPNNNITTGQILTTSLAGVYTLNLTTMTGCPGPTLTYTLVSFPKPNASFAPNQTSACSQTVSFTNTSNISSGSITSTLWSFGDGNTSINSNTFNNYTTTGTFTVQLICSSNMGCKDTAVIPVTINALPTAIFSANSACANSVTSFTNNSSVSSGSIISTNWSFGDGLTSTSNQPSHQYAASGSYSVTLTISTNNNCTNTITQSVTVNPLPNVMFSANSVCQGNVTNYINNSNISSGSITNYVWDYTSDGTPDNTTQNTSNTFATSGTYTTQLMAISNLNCIQSVTQVINVYPNPVVQFTSQPVCFGAPVVFTNSSSINSGLISSYTWSFGDGTTSPIANTQHLYNSYGNYNVQLTATSNHNCSNTLLQTAIVHPKPIVQFQSTTACLNQATQFNNQSSIIAGSIIKYRWDFDNNNTIDDSTSNPSYIYGLAGTIQCRLIAISNNNCSNQNINPVTIHQNPAALFSAPSTCMPSSTQFQNLSTSSDGLITNYNWDFNGDNIIDNLQQNPTYNFAQTGNYGVKLEVQTQYGCSNSIIKSAYVNATPSVLFAAQHKIGCPSLCVNFVNNCSIGSGNIVTYQWIFGDISSPDFTQNPTHCYASGNYNVTLKAVSDSGCVASSMQPNFVTVYPTPIANFNVTPSVIEITEPLIEVEDKSTGATAVNYVFSDGTLKNTANFTYLFTTDVAKTVFIMQKVVNSYGCRDSIVKQVDIKPAYVLYIPNAFTPNSDGLNDGFKALGIGIAQFKLQIFDRWGVLIFESDDINKAWDGSVNGKGDYDSTKEDVYVWKAEVTDVLKQHHDLIGHVTLVK